MPTKLTFDDDIAPNAPRHTRVVELGACRLPSLDVVAHVLELAEVNAFRPGAPPAGLSEPRR